MQTVIHLVVSDANQRAAMERMLGDAELPFRSYPSAAALLDRDVAQQPGCVVADLGDDMSGFELRRRLRAQQCDAPLLLLARDEQLVAAFEAAGSGDVAIIERPVRPDDLVNGISQLLEMQQRRQQEEVELQAIESRIARLTQREIQVTMKVLQGASNKEISSELGISVRTVEKHRAAVMNKLGATNLAELCRMRRHCERVFESFNKLGVKAK